MATAPVGDAPPNEDAMVRRRHPLPSRRGRVPYTFPDLTPHMCQSCASTGCTPPTHPSRIWQAQLPPLAPPRSPPPAPEKLGIEWALNRLHQVAHFFDQMTDGSLPGGIKFLSQAHGEDTRAKADELLKKAVRNCMGETNHTLIGNSALWAILLAPQAHALLHGWGKGNPTLWDVRAMHALLRALQDQRVRLDGGSRAPCDARTVGKGRSGEEEARARRARETVAGAKHVRAIDDAGARVELLEQYGCDDAALKARLGSEGWRPDGICVPDLGPDVSIKAKVGHSATWLGLRSGSGSGLGVGLGIG